MIVTPTDVECTPLYEVATNLGRPFGAQMRFVSNSQAFRPGLGSSRTFGAAGFPVLADWYAAPDTPDRRRRLLAWSRHDATPRQLLVELTADCADYVPAPDDAPTASPAATFHRLLTAEPNLTARDLLARWPPDAARPSPQALHRHLSQAIARDEIICTGAGHRYEPYRYRVAEN